MQHGETNNNQPQDVLFDCFRSTLKDHQTEVPAGTWERIHARIQPKKRRLVWLMVGSGMTAAATILWLLWIVRPINTPLCTSQELAFKPHEQAVNSPIPEPVYAQNTIRIAKHTFIEGSTVEPHSINIDSTSAEPAVQPTAEVLDSVRPHLVRRKKCRDTVSTNQPDGIAYTPKKNMEWKVVTSLGSYQTTKQQQDNLMLSCADRSTIQSPFAHPEIETENISDVKFAQPISFGLLLQKSINQTWSVESGLVYTYLSTTYQSDHHPINRSELKLHYVGIPINLVANLFHLSPSLSVYGSIGGMCEKGVLYESIQDDERNQSSSKGSIDDLQWSLHSSLGLSCRIIKHWDIYLEAEGAHYFDNKQPLSIRTEKQDLTGVQSGFRFHF